jgi:hypothetical protein
MKPSNLIKLIMSDYKSGVRNRPIYIEGPPGGGKSAVWMQAAKQLDVAWWGLHGPLLQPEDYGFPVVNGARTDVDFIVSRAKFPLVGSDCPDFGIFVVEELGQMEHSGQKIIGNVFSTGEIHGKKLKPGWMLGATGNRAGDRAGSLRLLSHLRDRVTPITMETSLDDWTEWALDNGVHHDVIAYVRMKPEVLNAFDPQQENNPTARSWSQGVSARLGIIPPELELEVFSGEVGQAHAAEFMGFMRVSRKMPSPDAIVLDPSGTAVPTDPSALYALGGALAYRATPANFGRLMTYVKRMPPEFNVLFVRDVVKRCPDIQSCPDFTAWAAKDGAKLLT